LVSVYIEIELSS